MTKLPLLMVVLVPMLGLAGCGGPPTEESMTFAEQLDSGRAMYVRNIALPYTSMAVLPTVGSVRYDGYVISDLLYNGVVGNTVSGTLTLNANFANDAITGSATDFVDLSESAYTGTLNISGGSVDRTLDPIVDYTISAGIGGVLTGADATVYTVDGAIRADFLGAGYQAIYGLVDGTATSTNGVATLEGEIIAER